MSKTWLPDPRLLAQSIASMRLGIIESTDRETWRAVIRDAQTAQRVPECRVLTAFMPVRTDRTKGDLSLATYGYLVVREDPFCIPIAPSSFSSADRKDLEWCVRTESARFTVGTDGKIQLTQESTGTKVTITKEGVIQIGDATTPQQGVVNGEGIDPFTGATYFALGNASAKLLAEK